MTETKNTFRILFYIKRNAPLRDGSAPIMGRITINGERTQFSTRLSVDPQIWDTHSGRALGRSAPAERINKRLNRIRMRLEQCYESLLDLRTAPYAECRQEPLFRSGTAPGTTARIFPSPQRRVPSHGGHQPQQGHLL